jgi:uncharacterized protein (UPF0332 family)
MVSDPDSACSRAYYAAFHAVTALFALRNQTFTKHSALRSALHRDLVHPGQWPEELGEAFEYLVELRETGDYGGIISVSENDAKKAVEKATQVLEKVRTEDADFFLV